MQYRKLGNTGLELSVLSFGASSLGGVFHGFTESRGVEVVFKAIELGINFIDVSPYYGYTKAEHVLGLALKQIPRDKYYLSTKVGRYGANGVNSWDYSAKRAKESVYESMDRLNVDYIDIINVHDIEFSDLQQVVDETVPALVELRDKGVVGHVGITGLDLSNFKWVIDRVPRGTVESVLSFCHYCLNDDALIDYFPYFEEHGVGVINASPFGMGLLTKRGAPDWHPAPEQLKAACSKAAEWCESKGTAIEKLAIQHAAECPQIASTLFSTTSAVNVERNIEYLSEPLDPVILEGVRKIIGDQMRVTWKNT